MALVTGKCQWAKVYDVDRMFPKDKTGGVWSIDLIVDDMNEKILIKEGLSHLINEKDGLRYIKFKRNEFKKQPEGEANTPPAVVDAMKKPMTDLIGNGSTVNISFTTYPGFKSKIYPTLQTVQVVSLVTFKGKKDSTDKLWDLNTIEGGYVAKPSNDGETSKPTFEAKVEGM